jgi:hypothetical protein
MRCPLYCGKIMLSIAALAYRGHSAAEVQTGGTLEERKTQLFSAYTNAMFKRRGKTAPYSGQQTVQWLAWLAAAMDRKNQSMFYLEWLQPDWLLIHKQQRLVTSGSGTICGLFLWLCFEISPDIPHNPIGYLGRLLTFILLGMFVGSTKKAIQPVEVITYQWSRLLTSLLGGLLFGLVSIMLGLIDLLDKRLNFNIVHYLSPDSKLIDVLLVGSVGLYGGLLFGLYAAMKDGKITTRLSPNEGIRRSLRYALLIGLISGLLFGLPIGLFGHNIQTLQTAIIIGFIFGLGKGGFACIQHLILRFLLWS